MQKIQKDSKAVKRAAPGATKITAKPSEQVKVLSEALNVILEHHKRSLLLLDTEEGKKLKELKARLLEEQKLIEDAISVTPESALVARNRLWQAQFPECKPHDHSRVRRCPPEGKNNCGAHGLCFFFEELEGPK